MEKKNKTYTEEFKKTIVELYENGNKNKSELAREYGVSESNVRTWIKRYGKIKTSTGEITNNDEILKLQKENQEIKMENEILKKALAIFSRQQMEVRYIKLKQVIVGWVNYFKIANMGKIVQKLDEWIRRRIRMCYWKQWKKIKTKHDNLTRLGIDNYKAWEYANTRKSYWRISNSPILAISLNNKTLERFGYTSLSSVYC